MDNYVTFGQYPLNCQEMIKNFVLLRKVDPGPFTLKVVPVSSTEKGYTMLYSTYGNCIDAAQLLRSVHSELSEQHAPHGYGSYKLLLARS